MKTAISVTVSASAIGRKETTVRQLKKSIMETDMTREEAIEKIRKMSLPQETMEILSALAPELRESEDERTRREIIDFICWEIDRGSVTKEQREKSDSWLAYLEKQKESLHIPKTCKENADSFTDEDERIANAIKLILSEVPMERFDDEGVDYAKCLAYLEKQKENPKSADSIPSDCVSDAKCENRWHKVGDSLPDNGRLVLANDCLGNTLLARYDGEGNWEVNVYDNEDYYCRNTITKWCEIPSEKQKPVEWGEEDEVYLQDALWCVKQAAKVARGENDMGACWSAERWLKSLRPSWKPSEEQPEVDLEKGLADYCRRYYNYDYPKQAEKGTGSSVMPHIIEAAKYFYELGLNARKEENK